MMEANEVLEYLAENEAVLTGLHFVYTAGGHGPAYINMRQVAHQADFLKQLGDELARVAAPLQPDFIIGPETLGRTLAGYTAASLGIDAIWCDIVEDDDGNKKAVFSEKLNFGRLVAGKRFFVVDDLLTTGSSIRLVVDLIRAHGGEVIGVGVVVRRTLDIVAETCNVPVLEVLAEVEGFEVLAEDECKKHGPCHRNVPIVRRPGHGWQYEENNPNYPGGFMDLRV